jgi:hypothetical protein
MALGSTQPLTEMSTRNLPGVKGRPARKVDNPTAVYKMWEPRRLTTLWASTACYRDSFTFFTDYQLLINIITTPMQQFHKVIIPHGVKKFLATYGTLMFITVFRKASEPERCCQVWIIPALKLEDYGFKSGPGSVTLRHLVVSSVPP